MDADLWQLRLDLLLLANGKIIKAAKMEKYVRSGVPGELKAEETAGAEGGVVAFRGRPKKPVA